MKEPMARVETILPFTATSTVASKSSDDNGWIKKMLIDVPNFTNAVTATITITDPDGYTVFTSTAMAKGAVTAVGDLITAAEVGDVPIGFHPWMITCTLSGAPGGTGGSVKLVSYLKK